jgi:hypothetical protein
MGDVFSGYIAVRQQSATIRLSTESFPKQCVI